MYRGDIRHVYGGSTAIICTPMFNEWQLYAHLCLMIGEHKWCVHRWR